MKDYILRSDKAGLFTRISGTRDFSIDLLPDTKIEKSINQETQQLEDRKVKDTNPERPMILFTLIDDSSSFNRVIVSKEMITSALDVLIESIGNKYLDEYQYNDEWYKELASDFIFDLGNVITNCSDGVRIRYEIDIDGELLSVVHDNLLKILEHAGEEVEG